jgi:hypothetical protein
MKSDGVAAADMDEAKSKLKQLKKMLDGIHHPPAMPPSGAEDIRCSNKPKPPAQQAVPIGGGSKLQGQAPPAKPAKKSKEHEVVVEKGDSSSLRGYKTLADGTKTTFFNNAMTEETKKLIGDIAPKKMDAYAAAAASQGGGSGSAWNNAGTWEEKDVTTWASARLEALLLCKFCSPAHGDQANVAISSVKKLEGDAQIAVVRKRRRHIFQFRAELDWEATTPDGGSFEGTVCIEDLGSDCDGEYEYNVGWGKVAPKGDDLAFVKQTLRKENEGLQALLTSQIAVFVREFQAKE